MREVENLKEAGSRGAGLRILIGKRHRLRPTPRIFARRHRAHGASGGRTGRHHDRRSVRRPARARRTRLAPGRPAPLLPTTSPQLDTRASRSRRPSAAEEAALAPTRASPTPKAPRSILTWPRTSSPIRAASPASTAPALLAERRAGGPRRRVHGARLLVLAGARLRRPRRRPKTSAASPPQRALRRLGAGQGARRRKCRWSSSRAPRAACSATSSKP